MWDLWFYHGPVPMFWRFSSAISDIETFFKADPSQANETIFVVISDEASSGSSDDFRANVRKQIASYSTRWLTGGTILPMAQLRGKVQLLRRYEDTSGTFGINLKDWPDNQSPNFTKTNSDNVSYTVQDHWQLSSGNGWPGVRDDKFDDMQATFKLSTASTNKSQIFINNSSGTADVPVMTPTMLALGSSFTGMNETLRNWLRVMHPAIQRLGVVGMDFPEEPDDDLIQSIIQSNVFGNPKSKQKKQKPTNGY